MSEFKHTPEPWRLYGELVNTTTGVTIRQDDNFKKIICDLYAYGFYNVTIEEQQANAERIVACVNACAGIENPKKLKNSHREYLLTRSLLREAEKQRDLLLEVLKEIIDHTTIDFAERNGFGPQRLKASEVYDRIQWPANEGNGEHQNQ